MIISGVAVTADPTLSNEEVVAIVDAEIQEWAKLSKTLARVELSIDGDEVIVKAVEKSPVRRVRRITGYLSSVDNFNDAKRSECEDRKAHIAI